MTEKTQKEIWEASCKTELAIIRPLLSKLGFELSEKQVHIGGERYLMQAVTTTHGRKLILLGYRIYDKKLVVIKISSDPAGQNEIEHERVCREGLCKINFAYNVFFSPEELVYSKQDGYVISIQEFIEQSKTFLERPIEEQFELALSAFKAQEGARAATNKQRKSIVSTYGLRDSHTYLNKFREFQSALTTGLPEESELHQTLARTLGELQNGSQAIEQYCGFLTHTDFVPHNLRIKDTRIYLLDHSSLTFGNKYDGWARFINFMTLYNPELQQALERYVKDNRSEGEVCALRLMRLHRLVELIYYHADKLTKCDGDLWKLTRTRVDFWHTILTHLLKDKPVPYEIISEYKITRDSLRSDEEKERQKGLH